MSSKGIHFTNHPESEKGHVQGKATHTHTQPQTPPPHTHTHRDTHTNTSMPGPKTSETSAGHLLVGADLPTDPLGPHPRGQELCRAAGDLDSPSHGTRATIKTVDEG